MAKEAQVKSSVSISLGLWFYWGGAVYIAHQPNMTFWDGLIWFWYIGRYVAANFTLLHY